MPPAVVEARLRLPLTTTATIKTAASTTATTTAITTATTMTTILTSTSRVVTSFFILVRFFMPSAVVETRSRLPVTLTAITKTTETTNKQKEQH